MLTLFVFKIVTFCLSWITLIYFFKCHIRILSIEIVEVPHVRWVSYMCHSGPRKSFAFLFDRRGQRQELYLCCPHCLVPSPG